MAGLDIHNMFNVLVFMAGLGLVLSAALASASRAFRVFEDPRIDDVEEMLPKTNCGACGTAGCRPFAEALVEGEYEPALCTVNTREASQEIADYLGVEVGHPEKRVARLACAGGNHVAHMRARYQGLHSCRAAALVAGGPKSCVWGCLGLGDCEAVCEPGAISMDPNGLPVVDVALCTACNDCVEVCPKGLFSIHPVSHRLWVACRNHLHGDAAEVDCAVACNACERCAMDAPEGFIRIRDNLAEIDYRKNELASPLAIEPCPTGAIVWLDDARGVVKGRQAKRILRSEPLTLGAGRKAPFLR